MGRTSIAAQSLVKMLIKEDFIFIWKGTSVGYRQSFGEYIFN